MPAVCLAFAIHQPHRLRRYSIFDASPKYVDDAATAEAVKLAAERAYVPTLKVLLAGAKRAGATLKVAISLSGTAMELLERHSPETLQLLHALHATKRCEFLGETYYGSLAALYSRAEFAEQVRQHRQMLKKLFGVEPKTFRHTELIYNNDVAKAASDLGFDTVLVEGVESVLASRSGAFSFSAPSAIVGRPVRLLLRNRMISDAIGRRMGDPATPPPLDFPLTDEKVVGVIREIGGQLVNLFFDMESFGLWQPRESGAIDLLANLPARLAAANCEMFTPGECVGRLNTAGELDVPHLTSWCGPQRDGAAWLGNAMQKSASQELYAIEAEVKAKGDRRLLADFHAMTAADHVAAMATRTPAEEAARRPSGYESPYDAYINFMNVLENLRVRVKHEGHQAG